MSENTPIVLIKKKYNELSPHQKNIANYIVSHVDSVEGLSINAIADNCAVSTTTVIRFLNKLGYQSYPDFKMDLVRELNTFSILNGTNLDRKQFEDGYQNIQPNSTVNEIIRSVTATISRTIQNTAQIVSEHEIEEAVNLMCIADNIVFYGAGGSGPIAMDGYHRFLRLGMPVFYDANVHLTMIKIAHLSQNSIVLLVSHTGESREVLQCALRAKEAGCKVVGITSYVNSSLAKLSDIVLHSASYDISNYNDALVSRFVQLTILDILFVSVFYRKEPESTRQIQISRKAISGEKNSHGKNVIL